jgi:4-amino-4-deoxy-L-arabinose transferase-like glycosyltransferase
MAEPGECDFCCFCGTYRIVLKLSDINCLFWRFMRVNHLSIGLFAGLTTFLLLVTTAGTVGVTWDEPIYSEATERAAHWLHLIMRGEFSQAIDPYTFGVSWGLVNEHPPLLRFLNAVGWMLTHTWLPTPVAHRIGSIALAAVAVGTVVGLTAYWRSLAAALFAGAALLTMPRLFHHMHLTTLDFPLAAIWVLGTLIFFGEMKKMALYTPLSSWRPSFGGAFVIGAWIGLGLLTKINAVLLLPFWGIWILLYRRTWRHVSTFALSLPIGLLVLIGGWPWIWKEPFNGLWNWVQFFRVHFEIRQWFAGTLYIDTPWYLPFVMVLITTPLVILVLAGIGAVTAPASARSQSEGSWQPSTRQPSTRQPSTWRLGEWRGLHLLGITTVLGYYALTFTPIHDQERLLLPALVHLAILSGDGFAYTWRRLHGWIAKRWAEPRKSLLQVAFGLLLLLPGVVANLRMHPHQLAYYNELVGGPRGAQMLGMETIYFATTYGHFLPWLNQLPAGSKIWVMPNSWDVLYYYQKYGDLNPDLVVLRVPYWGSFYDDQGVLWQEGTLEDADYALIERRQTTFNNVIPEYAIQLTWAAEKPELARLEQNGVVLATLHSK